VLQCVAVVWHVSPSHVCVTVLQACCRCVASALQVCCTCVASVLQVRCSVLQLFDISLLPVTVQGFHLNPSCLSLSDLHVRCVGLFRMCRSIV